MEEKIKGGLAKWLRKDNLLILLLLGILLVVIALPTEKSGGQEEGAVGEASGGAGSSSSGIAESTGITSTEEYTAYLERRLEETLSRISGVGSVQVMITLEATEELVVEKDQQTQSSNTTEEDSQGGSRYVYQSDRSENTVYHSSGSNEPYVVKTLMPEVSGVVVVAQGAGTGQISKEITDVVQALFGVEAHKVKVVKMEGSVNISE
ncbi:MAG: stage III sporulation protein AG [Lachnospiraceae bacterium]|nr:stage III sporulation protein AG [Lachnospiraceae bacterium]